MICIEFQMRKREAIQAFMFSASWLVEIRSLANKFPSTQCRVVYCQLQCVSMMYDGQTTKSHTRCFYCIVEAALQRNQYLKRNYRQTDLITYLLRLVSVRLSSPKRTTLTCHNFLNL